MGSSKKQTVGYRYYLTQHMIFCHGPVDRLLRIQFDRKDGWTGSATQETITVSAENLFGGDKREGGVSGLVDVELGAPDQTPNSNLAAAIGMAVPAFRMVTGLVFRGSGRPNSSFYWGMNPYLKPVSAKFQRIHTTTDGATQWYDATSEIVGIAGSEVAVLIEGFDAGDLSAYSTLEGTGTGFSWTTEGLVTGQAPGHHNVIGRPLATSAALYRLKTRFKVTAVHNDDAGGISLRDEDGEVVVSFISCRDATVDSLRRPSLSFRDQPLAPGNLIGSGQVTIGSWYIMDAIYDDTNLRFTCSVTEEATGALFGSVDVPVTTRAPVKYLCFVVDDFSGAGSTVWDDAEVIVGDRQGDMNPAHIIREALVDPNWGMGYLESDIDDASFTKAADTLFAEGMGISLQWDKQMPLEEFVAQIIHHISAALYVSRSTGKFILKLIRNDYVIDDLPVLGPNEIERVENFSYTAFGELVNSVSVIFWDTAANVEGSVTEADTALIQMQGVTINTTMQYPGFTNKALASRIALRDLRALSIPLRNCTMYVKTSAGKDLNIGDAFVMDWPDFLAAPRVMRVTGMALGDGKSNKIRLSVMEDVFELPDQSITVVDGTGGWTDPAVAPVPVTEQLTIEAPYYELVQREGQSAVDTALAASPTSGWVLVAGTRPSTACLNARVDVDSGAGYSEEGAVMDFSPAASLNGAISLTDTTMTLDTETDYGLVDEATHAQIDDEIVEIVSISGDTVTIARGLLDTVPAAHADNARVIFWDQYAEVVQTEFSLGETVNVKLLPVSQIGVVDISAATAHSATLNQRAIRPYAPGKLRIAGAAAPTSASGTVTVTWAHRDRLLQADQLVDHEASSIGPEPTTRYALALYDASNVLIIQKLDIDAETATFNLAASQNVTLKLWSTSDNGDSWQKHVRTFAYTSTGGVNSITGTTYVPSDNVTIIDGGGA